MTEQRPKFQPQETPLSNYNTGVIAWSFFKLAYADPLGPKVSQYDPYYMYSVMVQMGEQWIPHTWFTTIEDHIRIQVQGGTKDTVMKATYVRDQKKRALVVQFMSGPSLPRDEATVRQQVEFAVGQLLNESPGSSFDNDNLFNAPPAQTQQQALPDPFGASAPPPPVVPPTPLPPPVTPPPPVATSQPVRQAKQNNARNYMPFNDGEKAAWKARFSDIAELQLYAYAAILEKGKELDIKVKPTDQRELATSVSIQTWREFGVKGGLYGWSFVRQLSAATKDGALEKILAYTQDQFVDRTDFIKSWLGDVAEPVESIGAWKHAANIAVLLGIDSQVVYDDFEVDTMALLTQAIWTYEGARDEGMTQNESLLFVAEEYQFPKETMRFEEETTPDE